MHICIVMYTSLYIVLDQGIRIKVIRGDASEATSELYEIMFQLYQTTVEKMWGTQYLSSVFFQKLSKLPGLSLHLLTAISINNHTPKIDEFRKNLVFIVAYKHNEDNEDDKTMAQTDAHANINESFHKQIVAGTINFCKGNKFYGR